MNEVIVWSHKRLIRAWRVDRPARWLVSINGRVVASLPGDCPLADLSDAICRAARLGTL